MLEKIEFQCRKLGGEEFTFFNNPSCYSRETLVAIAGTLRVR